MFATVYIHTHDKPCLSALVAQHSMQRNWRRADQLDMQILHTRDRGVLRRRHWPAVPAPRWYGAASSKGPPEIDTDRALLLASCPGMSLLLINKQHPQGFRLRQVIGEDGDEQRAQAA